MEWQRLPVMHIALREINPIPVRSPAGRDVLIHEPGEFDKRMVADGHRPAIKRVRRILHAVQGYNAN